MLKTKKQNIFLICTLTALAGLLFGMDTGIISGAVPFLTEEFQLDNIQIGWIVSALMCGGTIGSISAGWLSWYIGRKPALIISAILFFSGSLICALAYNVEMLIIGRIILGLAVGIASFTTPLYLAEVAPENIRGRMISFYQLLITVGFLSAYIIDTILSYYSAWRWMLGIVAIPSIIFLFGLAFLPRSPRWLIANNRLTEAENILKNIRSDNDTYKKEIENIQESLKIKQNGWSLLKNNKNFRRSVFLGALLQIMQQLTGINIILYYAPKIMEMAGFVSTTHQMWATVTIGLVNVLFTFLAIGVIDLWGRRPTLIAGFTIMSLGMALLSLILTLDSNEAFLQYLAVLFILIFIAGFAMSAGPLVWTLCSEIQPLKGRDFGITISTTANWVTNMIISGAFPAFVAWAGTTQTFFIFAGLNAIFILITLWLVPETKNIWLEEIEKNLMRGEKLRNIGRKI